MDVLQFRAFEPVLTKNELSRLVHKKGDALKLVINRLVSSGILKKAGPRAGVYYNLLNDPHWENHIHQAALKRYPSAILTNESALSENGLHDAQGVVHMVVLRQPTLVEMERINWIPQTKEWLSNNRPQEKRDEVPSFSPQQIALQSDQEQKQKKIGKISI